MDDDDLLRETRIPRIHQERLPEWITSMDNKTVIANVLRRVRSEDRGNYAAHNTSPVIGPEDPPADQVGGGSMSHSDR